MAMDSTNDNVSSPHMSICLCNHLYPCKTFDKYCQKSNPPYSYTCIEVDVKYNAIKSVVMIIRSKYDRNTVFPNFILTGAPFSISTEVKYLGHYMTDDFRDDMDINRQRCYIYA